MWIDERCSAPPTLRLVLMSYLAVGAAISGTGKNSDTLTKTHCANQALTMRIF